ncbi:MAG: IPExxxVDY family protein [Flavobacteriales bacterium]|nr:IPExxxVDY family protein [Flavobacteriales bacterium]
MKDYRVCWYINNVLDIELIKEDDFNIKMKSEYQDQFSLYHHHDEFNRLDFNVVKNIGQNNYLIKECKHIDYFLVINGFHEVVDKKKILGSLKDVPHFIYVCELDADDLPSKDNLIFD